MEKNINYQSNPFLNFLRDSNNEYTSTVDKNRKEALLRSLEGAKGNIIVAFDNMLINDEDLRNEWNYEAKKEGKSGVNYPILARGLYNAKQIDKEAYIRAGGILDNTTNPGGGNFLQTTVADYVAETVEDLGLVAATVTKHDIANDGNFKIPVFDGFFKSTFVADSANFINLGTSIEGGITSVTLTPEKVGAYVQVFQSFLTTLSANRLQYVIKLVSEAQARAYDDAILNGSGSSQQPLGMNQNALAAGTDFSSGGDAFETLMNAVSAISDHRKGKNKDIVCYMNTAAVNLYKKLKYSLTNDRAGLIEINGDSINIGGYKVVVTDVIDNTGTALSKVSQVTVGYAKMYHWGDAKKPVIDTSEAVGFLNGTDTIRISGQANGRPSFNDAFAKFNISTGL